MDEDWVRWTRDNFVRPLRSLLRPALGDVRIFLDEQIEQVFLGLHVLLLHTHAPVS